MLKNDFGKPPNIRAIAKLQEIKLDQKGSMVFRSLLNWRIFLGNRMSLELTLLRCGQSSLKDRRSLVSHLRGFPHYRSGIRSG